MLSPDARSLYTTALTPPPGYIFDQAIATTFSLDPMTLLGIPLHLALLGRSKAVLSDPIALLEALRRTADRITVYVERGRIQAPTMNHVLYGLLESMVVEAAAPNGGAFHPKLWVLRFAEPWENGAVLLRLLVLSRNLTADHSWDLALQLEGRPTGGYVAANRELGELLRDLPSMASREVDDLRQSQAAAMGDEVRRTKWELPNGYEDVSFHVLGRRRGSWTPPRSQRLAVISPFVTEPALKHLRDTTGEFVGVIARPEDLNELPATALLLAKSWYTLADAAETEDGEENLDRDTVGLHAKAYILQEGWYTRLFVGSANATSAALLAGNNVEVLTELYGKKSTVGGIDNLLGQDGLGAVIVPYQRPEGLPEPDMAAQQAEAALEAGRKALAEAALTVSCEPEGSGWRLSLRPETTVNLDGIASCHAWPITETENKFADAFKLANRESVDFLPLALASVTGLVAFELVAAAKPTACRFVLNLPVVGLPDERDAAILRTIIRNRDGFLRYLLLLLGEADDGDNAGDAPVLGELGAASWFGGCSFDSMPLLEELTRAFARDPARLREVDHFVDRLAETDEGRQVIPPGFLDLWRVFKEAMAKEGL